MAPSHASPVEARSPGFDRVPGLDDRDGRDTDHGSGVLTTTTFNGRLEGSAQPLSRVFDVLLCDLDGVVYSGPNPVPHSPAALQEASRDGMHVAYLTNNASRPSATVGEHLRDLGIRAADEDVVTSAHAALRYMRATLPPGAVVLIVGAEHLRRAAYEAGFDVVTDAASRPDAVLIGFDPTVNYSRLAEACRAIHAGATFIATNADPVIPRPEGPVPGMGALCAFVTCATGREPIVVGKPNPVIFHAAAELTRARSPLVVGDRLDTDIRGARRAGFSSMLVMTGVTGVLDVIHAGPEDRPTFLATDLRGLNSAHSPAADGRCARALARYDSGTKAVVLQSPGAAAESLSAVVTAGWTAIDRGDPVERVEGMLQVP